MAKQISRVRILRDADGDVENVTVGDSLAEILDVDANITARCDLPQLETVTGDEFPEDLILQTSSSDGLETHLFNEIEIVSDDGRPSIRFICQHPNKYWEGRWGLATYLGAIRDEVSHCDEIAVEDIDLEDDWKLLVLGSSIDAQRPIGEQLREKATLIREIMGTAEISLEGMRWRPDYEINESLFCTEVLSPLLRRMGFVSVRYLHGVREYGKDLRSPSYRRFHTFAIMVFKRRLETSAEKSTRRLMRSLGKPKMPLLCHITNLDRESHATFQRL